MKSLRLAPLFALLTVPLLADPQLTSWFTANSGQYARIYQSTANETAGTKSTTWSRGTGTQTNPVYADVHEIAYSNSWVYIKSAGLASHVMGPWYLDAAKTQNFPNFPSNTAVIYRIPRTPTIPATKTSTGLGATGRMVNGVSMFDSRDAFSYVNASATDATPTNGLTGDGIWNRDGYHNEGVTFDPALAHQAGNNYHYHAHPIGLRYQLGDHVDYNATTNRYTEKSTAPTAHSPILAWAADGLPVYGPYGYSSPMDSNSGIRRMVSGFALRNGQNGTTAITVRQILPLWAQRIQGKTTLTASQYGPAVSTIYALGHYIEDFDYRGDLGQTLGTDFDLNEQNVRYCVTPEYPSGTWAYFTPINSAGTPQYPYTTGRQYYGSPTGGSTTISETVTTHFRGGPNTTLAIGTPAVAGTTVTLTWSAVEGGTYSVEASPNQSTWTSKGSVTSTGISAASTYTAVGTSGTEYGRVTRTALATYDTTGFTAATVSQTATAAYNPDGTPNALPTISSLANQTMAQNTATPALALTVGDAETPAASLTLSGSSSNTALVPNASIVFGGSGTSRTVTVTPATNQTGSATITLTVTDAGFATASTSFTLTVNASAPTVSLLTLSPSIVSTTDSVNVTALVAAPAGRTVSSVQLTYQNGSYSNSTVFNETMGAAAVNGWTGTGTVYPWTVYFSGPPTSPFSQTSAANTTASGSGNQFGMEINAAPPNLTLAYITTTNAINASSTAATVEFKTATSNLSGTMGWDFQTSPDGTTWTTRLSELTGVNHAATTHTYTLAASERVSTLKLRFRFNGSGTATTRSKVSLDDIKITATTGSAPVVITLLDNGLNGDGTAGDGVFGGTIPAQALGSTVTYSLTATDSTTAATTTANSSYTVLAPAPALSVTSPALAATGYVGGPFSPAAATYTVTNTGPGAMTWTASKTASWLTLSSPGGTLLGGASATVTATLNSAANTLASGAYNDTVTFANTSGGTGNTTRSVSLTVSPLSAQNDGLPDTWKIANGLNPLSSDPVNGPDGDPDHDGRPNLLEYALNTGASTSEASPVVQSLTDAGGGLSYLTFSYPRRLGNTGLTYTVQASTDLSTWPAPGTSVQELSAVPDGNGVTETVTVRILPALASDSKLFVRVLVTGN